MLFGLDFCGCLDLCNENKKSLEYCIRLINLTDIYSSYGNEIVIEKCKDLFTFFTLIKCVLEAKHFLQIL